jgi:hypothetical protein
MTEEKDICNVCGKSVAEGTKEYDGRIPDFTTIEWRKRMGRPYPEGSYMCAECYAKVGLPRTECPLMGKCRFKVSREHYEIYCSKSMGEDVPTFMRGFESCRYRPKMLLKSPANHKKAAKKE